MNALHFACQAGSYQCTKILLEKKVFDINERNSSNVIFYYFILHFY